MTKNWLSRAARKPGPRCRWSFRSPPPLHVHALPGAETEAESGFSFLEGAPAYAAFGGRAQAGTAAACSSPPPPWAAAAAVQQPLQRLRKAPLWRPPWAPLMLVRCRRPFLLGSPWPQGPWPSEERCLGQLCPARLPRCGPQTVSPLDPHCVRPRTLTEQPVSCKMAALSSAVKVPSSTIKGPKRTTRAKPRLLRAKPRSQKRAKPRRLCCEASCVRA